jgi:hypothetical protein
MTPFGGITQYNHTSVTSYGFIALRTFIPQFLSVLMGMVLVISWTYERRIGHTKSEKIIQIISKLSLQLFYIHTSVI